MGYDIGLLILRIGIGAIFVAHGWPKLLGGAQSWTWLGSKMSLIGIRFVPLVWGLIASLTEFLGGALLVAGLGTRSISFLLAFQMFIATLYHLQKGDSFNVYSHPLSLLVVFIALVFTGAGALSLDRLMR